jgi:hypothetical protein
MVGAAGQTQAALGRDPWQVWGAPQGWSSVLLRQPVLGSDPQVSSLPEMSHSVPALEHSVGGVGHVPQVTEPAAPVQGCTQATGCVATRHLLPSSEQVTIALPVESQNVPG